MNITPAILCLVMYPIPLRLLQCHHVKKGPARSKTSRWEKILLECHLLVKFLNYKILSELLQVDY